MIALFMGPSAHGFFVRFATGRLQQLKGFVLEGLTQIAKHAPLPATPQNLLASRALHQNYIQDPGFRFAPP
jgi:hypothetical protein